MPQTFIPDPRRSQFDEELFAADPIELAPEAFIEPEDHLFSCLEARSLARHAMDLSPTELPLSSFIPELHA